MSIPVPDELTHYSSRRLDEVDELAFPVLSQHVLDLLRSSGEELHPEAGELLGRFDHQPLPIAVIWVEHDQLLIVVQRLV